MAARCCFLFLACAICTISVSYYIYCTGKLDIVLKVPAVQREKCPYQWPEHIKHTEQFKSFRHGSYVYSAYYDSRVDQNNVRIIGLADLEINSHLPTCILWYNQSDCDVVQASVFRVGGTLQPIKNPSSDYLCTPRPSQIPTHVTLTYDNASSTKTALDTTLPIGNTRPPKTPPYNLTVCVHSATFKGYPNRNLLIEFIEIYSMLGADKIVMYKSSANAHLRSVVDYYSNKGILDVHSWNLPAHTTTYYYAQAGVIQECIYRHMYQTRHLALVNLDEFIFPKKHDSLVDYLTTGKREDADLLIFQNVFFPINKPSPDTLQSNKTLKNLGSVVLTHMSREKTIWGYVKRCKLVVRPQAIIVGQVHLMLKLAPNATIYEVPTSEAQMHHYRQWKSMAVELDKTAYRFLEQIRSRLMHAHSAIT